MSLFIQTLSLLPAYAKSCTGVGLSHNAVELRRQATVGTIIPRSIQATLKTAVAGFEVLPDEAGVTAAVIDSAGNRWSFDGAIWQQGGYCSCDHVRLGLPTLLDQAWIEIEGNLTFEVRLSRLADGSSPRLTELKIGYTASGSLIDYLLNIGLPRFLSIPVSFSRWLSSSQSPIGGVNPERIVSAHEYPIHGDIRVDFEYIPAVQTVEGVVQVEEIPIVYLRLLRAGNYRRIQGIDSIRHAPAAATLLQVYEVCDYEVEVTIVANSAADLLEISETLFAALDEQGCIIAPPYGVAVGVVRISGLQLERAENDLADAIEGQLSSATFHLALLNLPCASKATSTDLLTSIDADSFDFHPLGKTQ